MPSPSPYSWKTDEFTIKNEARPTEHINAPIEVRQPGFATIFRCPNCSTHMPPLIERKISTAGWITFAVLLVTIFPLFWIGLLMREDVPVCQICKTRLVLGPYR